MRRRISRSGAFRFRHETTTGGARSCHPGHDVPGVSLCPARPGPRQRARDERSSNAIVCPPKSTPGKTLEQPLVSCLHLCHDTLGVIKDGTWLYRASKRDCDGCAVKPRCCPNTPAREIPDAGAVLAPQQRQNDVLLGLGSSNSAAACGMKIASRRMPAETDDDVGSRLMRAPVGTVPG